MSADLRIKAAELAVSVTDEGVIDLAQAIYDFLLSGKPTPGFDAPATHHSVTVPNAETGVWQRHWDGRGNLRLHWWIKPAEPLGAGAVVEDHLGNLWTRIAGPDDDGSDRDHQSPPWRRRGCSARWWDSLKVTRVLSEGVTS